MFSELQHQRSAGSSWDATFYFSAWSPENSQLVVWFWRNQNPVRLDLVLVVSGTSCVYNAERLNLNSFDSNGQFVFIFISFVVLLRFCQNREPTWVLREPAGSPDPLVLTRWLLFVSVWQTVGAWTQHWIIYCEQSFYSSWFWSCLSFRSHFVCFCLFCVFSVYSFPCLHIF